MKASIEAYFSYVLFLILFVCFSNTLISQNFSNRGTDFWVGHMGHIDGTGSNFKLYISSTVNTSGTVSVPLQGWSMPFTITANTFAIITVPSSSGYIGCSDCMEPKGIHIVANDDVAVYAHIYASARSDATLLLPTTVLDTLYYAMCYTQGGGYKSEFLVVAAEDNTTVEITPTANTVGGNLANVPFTVTLQQGEEYQVQSSTDLTGSKILSKNVNNTGAKKIVVFAGSTWNNVGCGGSGDSMFEQMYPLNAWGKNFITTPLKTKNHDMFRIMAGSDGTNVNINGVPHTLNQTEFFDTLLSVPALITTCKPITLSQYTLTEACSGSIGDPFMLILSPLEQTVNDVLLYSSPQQAITGQYINVVTKTSNVPTCLLDGSLMSFNPVPYNPLYSYSQNTVSAGSHTLVADSGFNAIAYGFGSIESYGYLAGANIKNLDEKTIAITPLPACHGTPLAFSTTPPVLDPTNWLWNFGDSTTSVLSNPTHLYADTGTYNIMLITGSYNGCDSVKDTVFYVLQVNGSPNADFSFPVNCFRDSLILTDLTTNPSGGSVSSWKWHFGDGDSATVQNTGHTYAVCDTFNIKLITTSDNGCKDSTTKSIVVHCLPTANYSVKPLCEGNHAQFVDSSYSEISEWSWNFGDGTPLENDTMPYHIYSTAGIYNSQLKVASVYGCTDSASHPVIVHVNPLVSFTYSNVCFGDSMYFNSTSSVASPNSITDYIWHFWDNSTVHGLENLAHFFPSPGEYSVALIVYTADSCAGAIVNNVNVYDAPLTTFTTSNACLSDSIVFINTSIDTIGSIVNWKWDFGDGSLVDSINWAPNHVYNDAGDYQVSLITYSSNLGCSDTLTDTITIFPMPLADFTATEVCLNITTSFTDSSELSSGTIASWLWSFGDALTSSTQSPGHSYDNFGIFNVELIVTTDNGCLDSITKAVNVHPLPNAAFTSQNVCDGDTMMFINQSSISSNPTNDVIAQCVFQLGDNSPSGVSNSDYYHIYASPGSYPVQLTVTSSFGCIDSIARTVVVNPNPVVTFTANDTSECEPLCVNFQNTSFVPGGSAASWLWNFGDNTSTTNTQDAAHCYYNDTIITAVTFSPVLTVTSDSGCVSVLTKNSYLTVFPNPEAQFTAIPQNASITYPVITITNTTSGADVWSWNFGDNQTDVVEHPLTHEYADTGTYTITLITASSYGCADTAYQTVVVEPEFLLYIPTAFTPNGDGVNDSFIAKGVYVNTFEMSIFDRWGDLVYKTDNIDKPWDGKVNNGAEAAQMDVYIYLVNVTDFKMRKHSYRGTVALVH